MAAPTVVSVSPSNGSVGVPVNTSVQITFDSEVDAYRLSNGGIVIEGPDQSKSIGGGLIGTYPLKTDEDEFLSTPNLKGIIKDVQYSFERLDPSSNNLFSGYDYGSGSGAGALFRTRVTLTSKYPLSPETRYTVYIIGDFDTTDDYNFGLSSRTVFDLLRGMNLGTGTPIFYGGFTGLESEQFFLEITVPGDTGTAEYEWWTDRSPVHRSGKTSRSYRLLKDGVRVRFTPDESFEVGDSFSVWCLPPTFMVGTQAFSFTTSTQTITQVPASSTLVSGAVSWTTPSSSSSSSLGGLTILSTVPDDRGTNVSPEETSISIVFSSNINESTITGSSVSVTSHAVDETIDQSVPFSGTLTFSTLVSGSTLTITLDPDQLYSNNLVVVELASSIAGIDGLTLQENYEFYYVTSLTPFYAGPRQVRLLLGPLGNTYPDETINLAIWEASREVQAIGPASIYNSNAYILARNKFVACAAAYTLSGSIRVSSGGARKRLADLDISRDAGGVSTFTNDLKGCMDRYELAMMSGGEVGFGTGLKPLGVVKGDYSLDEPRIGRGWVPASPGIANARTISPGGRRHPQTNRRKS